MRWKWRLGFLVIAVLEIPFVLWISTAMAAPPEILLYAGGILALVLMAMLLVRPLLFTFLIVWLGGVMGSAWYFVRFLPPTAALGVGATPSTVVAAVCAPGLSPPFRMVLPQTPVYSHQPQAAWRSRELTVGLHSLL